MKKHRGLALYIVLLTAGLLSTFVLVAVACLLPEGRASRLAKQQFELRMGAEQAALWAVAELQAGIGRDKSATVLDESGGLVGLSSSGVIVRLGRLAGVVVDGDIRWSWRVEDFSQAYDEAAAYASVSHASAWAKSSLGRQKLYVGPMAQELSSAAQRALELGDRAMFEANAGLAEPLGLGWGHFGLLTDPVRGGFKIDLTGAEALAAEFGPVVAGKMMDESMQRAPASGLGAFKAEYADRRLVHSPVLADFRLSMGFFNSRSDGRHRMRFHGSGLWWNPSAIPLLANAQHRLFLVELTGAPEVTVANLDSGATLTVSLDEAPLLDLGALQQAQRERGLWFWADISDKNRYGMLARGLLSGEIFGFVAPSGQSQGLARILAAQTWKYDDDAHGPTWKRPSPMTFRPDDRIQINVRFPERTSIYLRPAGPDPERDQLIADYPLASMASIEGIPFPDFQILTTGKDYSRGDSKGYVITERRACLRLRLRPRSLGEFLDAVETADLLRLNWDLRSAEELAEWIVDNPLTAALADADFETEPASAVLWDALPDVHVADAIASFAGVRVRDIPMEPRVSIGTFRNLERRGGKLWYSLMDKAFLSAPLARPEIGVLSNNPRFAEVSKSGVLSESVGGVPTAGGPSWVFRGAFNVNSCSVDAWKSLLGKSTFSWCADVGGPFPAMEVRGAPFFMMPSGAGIAQWGVEWQMNLTDSALRGFSSGRIVTMSAGQSVRELGAEAVARLATKIVELQSSHGWPYVSLQSFAESGLLRDAIKAADINGFLPAGLGSSRLSMTEADLLEAFAPMLTVRGDTFRIIARAEALEFGGGYCEMEFIIQRTYSMHDAAFLGRRFRVVSAKVRK